MKRSTAKQLSDLQYKIADDEFLIEVLELISCEKRKHRFGLIIDMIKRTSDGDALRVGHVIWAYQESASPELPAISQIPDLSFALTMSA